MNDKQVEAFLAICESGSMNRAAEKLYISQPALKKRIDTLEAEIGTELLQRTNEGCILTQAGLVFREGVTPIHEQIGRLMQKVRGIKQQRVLRVCTLPDISLEGLDSILIAFAQENPDVFIEWIPLPTSQWLDAVEKGDADLCSCPFAESEIKRFDRRHIRIQPTNSVANAVCVLSRRHPLAVKEDLMMHDLKDCEVYAGPLAYYCGGLKEYAEREGLTILPDENAGKRYEVIERCERGAIYIQTGDYADSLRPLAVRPISGFTCRSCWVWHEESTELAMRLLASIHAKG